MKGKKGALPAFGLILMFMLAGVGVVYMIDWGLNQAGGKSTPSTLAVTGDSGTKVIVDPDSKITERQLMSCDGIASVKLFYDDQNYFRAGTNPGGNVTIFAKKGTSDKGYTSYKKLVNDGATTDTLPVLTEFKGLAGNDYGTPIVGYFAEEVSFSTVCADKDLQPRLKPATAPTITIVNDDGITKNADATDEDMSANSAYSPCMIVRSPSLACSSRYGAIVVFEYNSTAIKSVDSRQLTQGSTQFLVPHTNLTANTALNQYRIMEWNGGELCDGDRVEICFDIETTSATINEKNADMQIHWYPINKDLNARTLEPITGIYDEDNNLITVANTVVRFHTS